MEIMQVTGSITCTQRVDGLGHMNLRVLRNTKGKESVAVDQVGASPGTGCSPPVVPPPALPAPIPRP